MHKIKSENAHDRKREIVQKMERILWRTVPRRKRETYSIQKLNMEKPEV